MLRRGRNNVVATCEIRTRRGRHARRDGVLTSAILVPEGGPPEWDRPLVLDTTWACRSPERCRRSRVARAATPSGTDAIEIDLADELRNPWGILHGGVVATLVDLAAEHATGGGHDRRRAALPRTQPRRPGARDRACRSVRARDGELCRVEVRDEGADRVTAVAITSARAVDVTGVNSTGRCWIVVTSELAPALGVDTFGHVDVGQPGEQLLEQDPDLGAGQVRAEAEVRTGAEREVQVRRAVDAERVGVVEHVGVAVRRRVDVEQRRRPPCNSRPRSSVSRVTVREKLITGDT